MEQQYLLVFGILIFGLLGILTLGVPIAFAIGFIDIVLILILGKGAGLFVLASTAYEMSTGFTLLAVPAYILMAELLIESGFGSQAYTAMSKWIGRLPGGLAIASVAGSTLTAATVGSSVANTAIIGLVATNEMDRFGYDIKLATGSIMAGGALGILIPPSLTFIIFGIATDQSIAHLFMGGLLPGIVLSLLFVTLIIIMTTINPRLAPKSEGATWDERWASLRYMTPVVIVGGGLLYFIYSGICTPTEVGALGSLVAFILYMTSRKFTWSGVKNVGLRTVTTTTMVIWLVIAAMTLGHAAAYYGVSETLVRTITGLTTQKYLVILGINVLLLILGCFLDPAAIIMITTPFLMPIILYYGFDPLWFGVMFIINMEMAYLTPPFGLNLFVMKKIAPHVPMSSIMLGTIPFVACQALCIVLLVIFPQLALWLPSMMTG